MMSQNRQEARDRRRAENDYMINLKSELEIGSLHEKIDLLMDDQYKENNALQKVQLVMLKNLHEQIKIITKS